MIRYNKVIKLSRSIECITICESLFMTQAYSVIYVKILAFKINFEQKIQRWSSSLCHHDPWSPLHIENSI